jgi:hypothetical protein
MICYSSEGISTDERARVKDQMGGLAKEVDGFRSAVERLLAQLAASEEESAPGLMTKALEAVDMMNNAVTMQEEVGTRTFMSQSLYSHMFAMASCGTGCMVFLSSPWVHLSLLHGVHVFIMGSSVIECVVFMC